MATFSAYLAIILGITVCSISVTALPVDNQNATCVVGGVGYEVGEPIGDPCDNCLCTPHGTMCSLRTMCPPANCVDKVKREGECCYTCPNGPNCLFNVGDDRTVIPHSGCRHPRGFVCYCYESRMFNKMLPYCLPPFPGDSTPPCISGLN